MFYKAPDVPIVPSRKPWIPGVDVKAGSNGYVILPPGEHVRGGRYEWTDTRAVVSAPQSLVESILSRPTSSWLGGEDLDIVEVLNGVPEGHRDDALFRAACAYRNQLNDNRTAVEVLILHAAANCTPPFSEMDALRKVEQAFRQDRYGPADWMIALARGWEEQASRGRLNLRQASEIMQIERPDMLIEDVLPPGGLFQIFGQTG